MKERFINIFDMSKKRKGIAALCAISVIVVISGAAIAYGAVTDFTIVDTDKFSVSLPKDWTVESASDGTLSFRDKNGEIGSFSTLSGDGSLQGFREPCRNIKHETAKRTALSRDGGACPAHAARGGNG